MAQLKTIDIHGKGYVQVADRIKYFRENHENGSIITEMVSNVDGVVIFKANIVIDQVVRATGFAFEKEGSSNINRTSHLENCETSAIGRALGIFGIGLDGGVASAEEVKEAKEQQDLIDEAVGRYALELREAIGESNEDVVFDIIKEINKKPHAKSIKDDIWNLHLDKLQKEFCTQANKNVKAKRAKESAMKFAEDNAEGM